MCKIVDYYQGAVFEISRHCENHARLPTARRSVLLCVSQRKTHSSSVIFAPLYSQRAICITLILDFAMTGDIVTHVSMVHECFFFLNTKFTCVPI